jgi:hypothetical protein
MRIGSLGSPGGMIKCPTTSLPTFRASRRSPVHGLNSHAVECPCQSLHWAAWLGYGLFPPLAGSNFISALCCFISVFQRWSCDREGVVSEMGMPQLTVLRWWLLPPSSITYGHAVLWNLETVAGNTPTGLTNQLHPLLRGAIPATVQTVPTLIDAFDVLYHHHLPQLSPISV